MTFRNVVLSGHPRMEIFLLLAALMNFSYWFTIVIPDNKIFYLMRVLASTLEFASFLAGYAALRFKRAAIVWLGVLGIGLLFATLTGGRGAAFIPIMYFLIGFFIGLPDNRRRIHYGFTVLLPATLGLLILGVYIGIVRDITGRINVGQLFRQGSIITEVQQGFSSGEVGHRLQEEGIGYKAFRRLTTWPPLVIPTATPDPVPYRGYHDFLREVRLAFQLGILSGNLSGQGTYFSNIFLKAYGFPVHADQYGKVSNVEMPTAVDGFTRGGWLGAFAATFFAFIVLMIVETLLRKQILRRDPVIWVFLTVVLMEITCQRVNNSPAIDALRTMCLYMTFATVCFFCFKRASNYLGLERFLPRR